MPLSKCLLPAVALGLMLACGTETGNPDGELILSYNARTSNPDQVAIREDGTESRVDEVWLRLDDVHLDGCFVEEAEVLPGIGFADHGGADAAQQDIALTDLEYCGLRTRFVLGGAGEEDEDIAGSAIALRGSLADGRSFLVRIDQEIELDIALGEVAIVLAPEWLLSFDVAAWIDPAELDALEGDPIVVDAATHAEVLQRIQARIVSGVQVHADVDGNGQLDPGDARIDVP